MDTTWAIDILKNYGLAGLVMACLAWLVVKQRGDISDRDTRINDLQEKRVAEAKEFGSESIGALKENTMVLERHDEVIKALLESARS